MDRLYQYVGPKEIRNRVIESNRGFHPDTVSELRDWLGKLTKDRRPDGAITLTFVIDETAKLRLAPRRSEHVACAGGGRVLSAGEMTFSSELDEVVEVTNQSTGFCPEPSSWPHVERELDRLGILHPGQFTSRVTFRKCPRCGQRNLVKDDWFQCETCGADLPHEWNF